MDADGVSDADADVLAGDARHHDLLQRAGVVRLHDADGLLAQLPSDDRVVAAEKLQLLDLLLKTRGLVMSSVSLQTYRREEHHGVVFAGRLVHEQAVRLLHLRLFFGVPENGRVSEIRIESLRELTCRREPSDVFFLLLIASCLESVESGPELDLKVGGLVSSPLGASMRRDRNPIDR